jgi:sugar O-acyltransferase (sialic acid O-acetyltransferase NeuD family)
MDYVMFGHSPLFGDLVDIIVAKGGRLKKVVQNIPEQVRPGTKPLSQLIDEQERSLAPGNSLTSITVQQLESFVPEEGENYIIGFRSHRLIPLWTELRRRFCMSFGSLIHPRAIVSPTAQIGEGAFIGAGVIVGSGTTVGRFSLLNRGCTIGHDCILADFANVGPGANLASFVSLQRSAVVGIGATLLNWVVLGEYSVVAAGATVIASVPAHTLVMGVPAKPAKQVNLDAATVDAAPEVPK